MLNKKRKYQKRKEKKKPASLNAGKKKEKKRNLPSLNAGKKKEKKKETCLH